NLRDLAIDGDDDGGGRRLLAGGGGEAEGEVARGVGRDDDVRAGGRGLSGARFMPTDCRPRADCRRCVAGALLSSLLRSLLSVSFPHGRIASLWHSSWLFLNSKQASGASSRFTR